MSRCGGERYSLWLKPTGDACERLARLLRELRTRHGGPEFAPHVTLLGSIAEPLQAVLLKAAALAATLRPWMLSLEGMDYLDEYFRCLFVRVAPSRPLREAYHAAREVFGYSDDRPFMPHLSLLYGDYRPSLKEAVIAEWGPRLDLTFKVRALHVYSTRGEPCRWRCVRRFGLD